MKINTPATESASSIIVCEVLLEGTLYSASELASHHKESSHNDVVATNLAGVIVEFECQAGALLLEGGHAKVWLLQTLQFADVSLTIAAATVRLTDINSPSPFAKLAAGMDSKDWQTLKREFRRSWSVWLSDVFKKWSIKGLLLSSSSCARMNT